MVKFFFRVNFVSEPANGNGGFYYLLFRVLHKNIPLISNELLSVCSRKIRFVFSFHIARFLNVSAKKIRL